MRAALRFARCLAIAAELFFSQRDNGSSAARIYKPREFPLGGTTLIIVIIILLLLIFGTFPAYPYSRNWGYYPTGGLGTILLIIIILWLLHVI